MNSPPAFGVYRVASPAVFGEKNSARQILIARSLRIYNRTPIECGCFPYSWLLTPPKAIEIWSCARSGA
jgi:hypothetical protein